MKPFIIIIAGWFILTTSAFTQPKLYMEIQGNFDGDGGNIEETARILSEKSATANIIVYRIEIKNLPALRSLTKPDSVYKNRKTLSKNKKGENIIKNNIVWVYNKSEGKATEFEFNAEAKYWERRPMAIK